MDSFDEKVLEIVDQVYGACRSAVSEQDRELLHTDADGVLTLHRSGWEIANHSSRHLPLLESTAQHGIEDEYTQAEEALTTALGAPTRSWVAPFDRPLQRSQSAVAAFRAAAGSRDAVLVGDRTTHADDIAAGVIYRSFAPVGGAKMLEAQLTRASRRSLTTPPHLDRQ
jgi:peptidoglycan/xylan/chitin deacetylase (PgdA/CDA1 family)